jgi:hypothetical protein
MSISEHFRYRNDIFQSDIFVSYIGITDFDVGCRISPTLRSMSMPTYARWLLCPTWKQAIAWTQREMGSVYIGGGGEAGPSPPERGKDKQLRPSEGRDNMEKDEEEQPIGT